MSETTFKIKREDGTIVEVTDAIMWQTLLDGPMPTGMTVSVKESRQRAKFVMTERFLSLPINCNHLVDLVNSCVDLQQRKTLRSWLYQALQKNAMEAEAWLHLMIEAMMGKSAAQQFLRDPNNPWVRAGWDITQGMRNAGLLQAGGDS
jgi:hypothetical protein